jgi:heterodisulfide reductase subunit A-like polyferredoxin
MKTILEPQREIPVLAETEVIVVGGGPAGIGAALASARTGAQTILMDRFGTLGGLTRAYMAESSWRSWTVS